MAKEWTDEEVKALITDSVKIVAEDRDRATYSKLHERFGQSSGDPKDPKGSGGPPPPKSEDGDPKPKGRKNLWWGEAE